MMELLGLDLGPEGLTGVVVDGAGNVLRRARRSGNTAALLGEITKDLQVGRQCHAVGIATDAELGGFGALRKPPLKSARQFPPGAAAVAAEAWVGAARQARHAICLWVGDRVLAGILIDGRPWLGAHGHAGAAGWLALNPVERQDYRKYGSLAAEVSVRGIAGRLVWRIHAGDHSAVLDRAGDIDAITAAHVFDGARAGDAVATSVVRDTAKYLGMAAANLVAALDPEVIVIGGPIAAAGDLLIDAARQECSRRLPPAMAAHLRIEISPLAEDGIAIGAASLALVAGVA